MRRTAPQPLAGALSRAAKAAAPATLLARVQACWATAVGEAIAAEAVPVAERAGTVTVHCRSAAWASELELLAPELVEGLNEALGDPTGGPVSRLRAQARRSR